MKSFDTNVDQVKFFHLRDNYEAFVEPSSDIVATIAYTKTRSGVAIWDQRRRNLCSKSLGRTIALGRLLKGKEPNFPHRTMVLDMADYDLEWVIRTKIKLLQEELAGDSLYLQTK